ncbi:hypothetical protein [Roseovarius sp.]|uniref:F0F1 ATP synthase subunit B family protein n=1 Tax=Roseovarius sp. TaxID=1486281 RepID=UPI00356AABC4
MQIDWLTVAAQIVNFLVLVWLLQRFLYEPITDAMRRREERIEERLAEAADARQEAEDEKQRLKQEQTELEESKDDMLEEARQEAETLRERLKSEIREEMEDKRAAWRDHLQEERDAFIETLRRDAGQKVLEISQQVLADYADSDLSERVIATFTNHLKTLDTDTHTKLSEAAAEDGAEATVYSGEAVTSGSKGRITRVIHEALSTDLDVTYREDPDMVLGVRLTIGDYSAEWSAVRYLERLEAEMGEIIDAAGGKGMDHTHDTSENDERETA